MRSINDAGEMGHEMNVFVEGTGRERMVLLIGLSVDMNG